MKTYRRILVPLTAAGQCDTLLCRAAEIAQEHNAKMLVLRVLDIRSGFAPDGPAALRPEEAAARRAPNVKKRLDLLLARNNLGWAEAKVQWGEPKKVLAEVIDSWQPDLVLACAGDLPQGFVHGSDLLTVNCRSLLKRLIEVFHHPVHRPAGAG